MCPSEPLRDQLPEHGVPPHQTLRVPGPEGWLGQVPGREGTAAVTQVSELGWTGSCSPQRCPAFPQFGAGAGGEGKGATESCCCCSCLSPRKAQSTQAAASPPLPSSFQHHCLLPILFYSSSWSFPLYIGGTHHAFLPPRSERALLRQTNLPPAVLMLQNSNPVLKKKRSSHIQSRSHQDTPLSEQTPSLHPQLNTMGYLCL